MEFSSDRSGFSFIELIVVMGVVAMLLGFATVSLLGVQRKPTLTAAVNTLIADVKTQQTKAMAGAQASSFGVHVAQHEYVLFAGETYNPTDATNAVVSLEPIIFASTTFPGSEIVFASGSGEINNFSQTTNSIILVHGENSEQKTIRLNRYGVVTAVE